MTSVVDRLIEVLLTVWRWIVPWAILPDDHLGLVRRFGVTHRLMKPGWNWKYPLVEQPMTECSALESTVLREQSLITRDGVSVTLRCVITYRVVDAKAWIVNVNDAQSVMNDAGCLAVAELVPEFNAVDVLHGRGFIRKLRRRIRERAAPWGAKVASVGLADRAEAPVVRVVGVRGTL